MDEMAKYLEVDEDLKNGYKTWWYINKLCFVEDDKVTYQEIVQK